MSIANIAAHPAGRISLAALCSGVLLLSTGCMISPLDGDTIATNESKIHCVGATQYPNDMIHVEAYNQFTHNWDIIAHAYTGTSPVSAHGVQWYVWSKSITIPQWVYWQWDNGNPYARIRSKRFDGNDDYVGEELWTYETWEFEPGKTLKDFYAQRGTGTTEVRVYANQYIP